MNDPDAIVGIGRELLEASADDSESLLAELAGVSDSDLESPALVMRLRKRHEEFVVRVALEITRARRRAEGRIEGAARLWADREGLEQASSQGIARHKAARFVRACSDDVDRIADLCCGIGGDLIEFVRASGARVLGVDASPVRAAMAAWNSGATVETARVEDWIDAQQDLRHTLVHIDPARRVEGRRVWALEDLRPGPQVFRPLLSGARGAAIKLGPGLDPDELEAWGESIEIEWIGEGRTLSQAIVWSGALLDRSGSRRATRIGSFSLAGEPAGARAVDPGAGSTLWEPDPALERAGLATRFLPEDAAELAPGLGLYRSDEATERPGFRRFRVLEDLAFREKDLRRRIGALGWSRVDIKTRGGAVDANQLAKRMSAGRAAEDGAGTVFVLRLGKKMRAYVCERL